MIRLLIVESHPVVRDGLTRLLTLFGDVEIAGVVGNGQETMARMERGGIDLILLDANLPDVGGAELIAWIGAREKTVPVLAMGTYKDAYVALRAFRAGAAGYLAKDNEPEILIGAIRQVAGGGRFLDPFLGEKIVFRNGIPYIRTSR